jgi:kanamycin kinase
MRKVFLEEEKRPCFPEEIRRMVQGSLLYDSSCGDTARVYYADCGLYVKAAAPGSLAHEARMGQVFHEKGLGPEVVDYLPLAQDWLVTREAKGQDLIHHTDKPLLLCGLMGEKLRLLHEISGENLPQSPSIRAYRQGNGDGERFERYVLMNSFPLASRDEAVQLGQVYRPQLKTDVLIHGDACLPNMMLEDGKITSLIDFSCAGAGDRHIDLFWAVWSLMFNLKTEQYTDLFLDAYGRQDVDREMIRAVSAMEALG